VQHVKTTNVCAIAVCDNVDCQPAIRTISSQRKNPVAVLVQPRSVTDLTVFQTLDDLSEGHHSGHCAFFNCWQEYDLRRILGSDLDRRQ